MESIQAGWQGSGPGLFLRGKLPDLISDPAHSKWWERALTGITQVGAELPEMILGGAFGTAAGTAAGGAMTANPAGAVVGGILGGGAGMFAVPGAFRETLTQAYMRGEISTGAEFWDMMRAVAKTTAEQAGIGMATAGAGGIAARTLGSALVPAIGESIAVPTAIKAIGAADTAAQIAAMTTIPAALQGRLPDAMEFMDAAIVIGGLKLAHVASARILNTYSKTGKTPAEQYAEVLNDPKLAEEYTKVETPEEVAKRTDWLKNPLRIQEGLFKEVARLDELEKKANGTKEVTTTTPDGQKVTVPGRLPEFLTDAEKVERDKLRTSIPDAEARLARANDFTASADRIYENFLKQAREADDVRRQAGITPLGDEHAQAVALLVRDRIAKLASILGKTPEEIAAERYPVWKDAAAERVAAEEAAIPPEAPRFAPPETAAVDIFWDPVRPEVLPRVAVQNLPTVEAPLAELKLSKEVPQFKAEANAQGIVQPLGGTFDRTGVAPIQVWERLDGSKEIISGRHRFDLAKRSGETTIPAQIHREADGFTAKQAANLDAELNIREEQGSVADYVQHFKATGITREAADQRGLLARAKGRTGFAIATDGAPDTIASHRAGLLSDEAALSISLGAPASEPLQALGSSMVQGGRSILFAVNTMKAVGVMSVERGGQQGDIFGFDDSAMREAEAMAKKASSYQRAIAEQIAAVNGAAKRPELAKKMGVDVQDPEGIIKRIVELRQEQHQWDNWPTMPELVAKLRELHQDPVVENFDLRPETPADLAAKNKEAVEQAKRKLAEDRAKDKTANVTADQADLFNPQGTLFQSSLPVERLKEMSYTQEHENPVLDGAPTDRVIDSARLRALRTEAARIESPEKGLFLYVTEDGRAVATGQPGTKVPQKLIDFAEREGLSFVAQRMERPLMGSVGGPVGDLSVRAPDMRAASPLGPAMPLDYRASGATYSGATYFGESGRPVDRTGQTLFQSTEPFYSALSRHIDEATTKAAPAEGWKAQIKGAIAKGTVKAAEVEATGLNDWLDLQKGKVTKEQVQEFLKGNGVKVEEVTLGGPSGDVRRAAASKANRAFFDAIRDDGDRIRIDGKWMWSDELYPQMGDGKIKPEDLPEKYRALAESWLAARDAANAEDAPNPKFSGYQLPGGENYRELLLTLPERLTFPKAEPLSRAEQDRAAVLTQKMRRDGNLPAAEMEEWRGLNAKSRAHIDELDAIKAAGGNQPPFRSGHFDQPNILAHVRFNERTDADGKRVLFLEELQSDWAQKGRKEGFSAPGTAQSLKQLETEHADVLDKMGKLNDELYQFRVDKSDARARTENLPMDNPAVAEKANERDRLIERSVEINQKLSDIRYGQSRNVPSAPFVSGNKFAVFKDGKEVTRTDKDGKEHQERYSSMKDAEAAAAKKGGEARDLGMQEDTQAWTALALKRMIRYAAENGFDRVAWTTGEQQAARYDLSKQIKEIDYIKRGDKYEIAFTDNNGGGHNPGTFSAAELPDVVGKEVAQKIVDGEGKSYRGRESRTLEGLDLKVGGEGMKGYYDKIVPSVANDILKKLGGGKVEETSIDVQGNNGLNTVTEYKGPSFTVDDLRPLADIRNNDVPAAIQRQLTDIAKAMNEGIDYKTAMERNGSLAAAKLVGGDLVKKESVMSKQASFTITDKMRENAMAGQPLFQKPNQVTGDIHNASYNVAEQLITTLQGANKSSVIHELGHHFLEDLKFYAMQEGAPAELKADWEIARREFAIGENGDISTASHEQMARTWERYLAEGVAPSQGLAGVFAKFKTWMMEIYGNIKNLGVPINPDIKLLFDHMLATDEQIQFAREANIPPKYAADAMGAEAEKMVTPATDMRKIEPGFKAEQISMEPYADELPPGPGEAPDNSHVNYAYIHSPLDVKRTMQRMAEIDQENIQKQRGGTNGVKSWEESNAEQAKYINEILGGSEDTLKLLAPRDPNASGPDVRLGVLKKLAVGAAKDSARLRDVVLEHGVDATVKEQLEYMGSIERARMIQAEFLGERASVARALNALKDTTEGSGEIGRMLDAIGYGAKELFQAKRTEAQEQEFIKAKLDEIMLAYKGKSVLDIAKLHKEIGTLKGSFKFAKEVTKATTWEKLIEGWRAGLLSGPVTHTTNLFGTEAFHVMRAPVDALASVIGMARGASVGMGEGDRASVSESVARITGMLGGIQDGIKVAAATFRLDDPTGKTEAYRTAIEGRKGEIIRIPLRLMGAEDALVTTMYMRGETKTLAIRTAFDENLNPATREFAERVDYLTEHPTPDMETAALAAATRMTFNMPLGEKGQALQNFVAKWNLQWAVPFIRTPINIAKELLRMSPFAPSIKEWRDAFRAGGVERDRALAEIAIGSGIMALTMAYAFDGSISGAGSPDPGKNKGKAGVWQPYSILIDKTWYEYSRIQPMGTLMGMAADAAAVWDHMNDEERDKIPKMLAVAFSNAITNQTFLQGITNVINTMSDPGRYGSNFFKQMAGSMVPNIIGQPTTMADPVVRETNNMLEAVQARIPGFRQELLPKRDWLGAPVETKERMGVIMPVREQPVSDDKVRQEAARLDLSMSGPPKKTHIGKGTGKLGDVELTPEERDRFARLGGEMAHNILTGIVNQPGYDNIPDIIQRKIFRQVITESHKFAAAMALPQDKRNEYIRSITEKMTAELEATE